MPVTPLSATVADLSVGGAWLLNVLVTDSACDPVDQAPVVTVTLPAGTTATPDVETVATGVYRTVYYPAGAGRHIASAVTAGYGAVDFAAYVAAPVTAAGMPTVDDLLGDPEDPEDDGYLGPSSYTVGEVEAALDAEAAAQRRACAVPAAYPDDLREALMRRVARNLSMRRIPLALVRGDGEAGDTVLYGSDPEIRRLERGYPRLPVG
jgi:hypothetical protein